MVVASQGYHFPAYVALNSKTINGSAKFTASGTIASDTMTANTLTTSGVGLTIKSDLVLCRGLNNLIYIDAQSGEMMLYFDVYMDAILKVQNGCSLG